jgi:hypothetical protein
VLIDIGAGREAELLAPSFEEAAPEEVADGDAVGFLVAESPVHAIEFREAVGRSGLAHGGCLEENFTTAGGGGEE